MNYYYDYKYCVYHNNVIYGYTESDMCGVALCVAFPPVDYHNNNNDSDSNNDYLYYCSEVPRGVKRRRIFANEVGVV